jgi:hypothetical protein
MMFYETRYLDNLSTARIVSLPEIHLSGRGISKEQGFAGFLDDKQNKQQRI